MKFSWKAFTVALLAASVINFVGVMLLLNPTAEADTVPDGPIVAPAIGFLIYVILSVALFDWAARQLHNAYKAAFVIGASQFILVNVDFVLSGKRGLMIGVASIVLIAVTWGCVAFIYAYLVRPAKSTSEN